ncbi:FAD binding domain-containing protein [Colletotrichum graminicola]|uniref:FAD binding domain-containing protein n=1 Tax=Colletotrichum graminicola (strain M1.001 / M2 / FGSC 10212) TaxID=645133 RepID=E3QZI9_COLGM|nr:FAD binding domain-containing protein [Colletotrichum graminicola M1.001]EFQ36277.1 FAD binding domain-containing protein [Colletotrichum graminicola M1.001]WDK23709.1 FAD binding domain-containing protein [Colletotrichum graminicola]
MTNESFRVIIIGGGPSGITAAYALYHAGIDFVLLERRNEVAEDQGASLVLSPSSLRVFHQFGILDQLLEIGGKIKINKAFTVDGQRFMHADAYGLLKDHHGIEPLAFHRAHLVQALYDNLPEAAKLRYITGKKLASITSTETGVTVTCVDGSSYTGSIVIGADGVHSMVRQEMRRLAIKSNPSYETTWDSVKPYKTNYVCAWASFPRPSEPGLNHETHSTDRSIMYITGKERGWIFLYKKLTSSTTDRITLSSDEVDDFAKEFMDWPIAENLKVKDVWEERYSAGGAGLEEGVCGNWSWNGRVVLVGDAAHKFTPNAGLGFNNGIQDVVALSNKLHRFVSAPSRSPLDFATLESRLKEYQSERRETLMSDLDHSALVTRMHAWSSTWTWIMARYVMSWSFMQRMFITYVLSPKIQRIGVIDFLPTSEPFEGTFKWQHPLSKNAPNDPTI